MTIGPKGPGDAPKGLAKVLQLRQPEKVEKAKAAEKTEAVQKTEPKPSSSAPASTFEGSTGTSQQIAAPVDGAGISQVLARLKARGLEQGPAKTAAASGPTFVQTAEGKVLSGSVVIESKSGLQKLTDVVRVGGAVTVQESVLKNADLLAMKSLKTVEGRLTFEGLRSS